MALLTYAEYTALYSSSLTQTQVEGFIAVVQAEIERYCNRIALTPSGTGGFESASRTEVRDGDGSDTLIMRYAPISAVTSIAITAGSSTTTYSGTDVSANFEWDTDERGELRWIGATSGRFGVDEYGVTRADEWGTTPCFPRGFQNVSIVYTGGWSTVPADLKQIVREMVAERIIQRGSGGGQDFGKQSATLGRHSYTRASADQLSWEKRWGSRLARFRKEALA